MRVSFPITLNGIEYEVEGDFRPSDMGDRDTPPSGDEWDMDGLYENGVKSDFEPDGFQEDLIWAEAKSVYEVQQGEGPE
jgi:hypothetical protein